MFNLSTDPDPLQAFSPITTLLVGRDDRGHWLVQEEGGGLEGCFLSQADALRFARWERHAYRRARVALTADPLVARVAPSHA
jgi:hypothetical protein